MIEAEINTVKSGFEAKSCRMSLFNIEHDKPGGYTLKISPDKS